MELLAGVQRAFRVSTLAALRKKGGMTTCLRCAKRRSALVTYLRCPRGRGPAQPRRSRVVRSQSSSVLAHLRCRAVSLPEVRAVVLVVVVQ